MKKSLLFLMTLSMAPFARASSLCTDQWPSILDKIHDLRKLNSCGVQFTLEECRANLGLVAGTAGAGAGAAGNKLLRKTPTSCSGLMRDTEVTIKEKHPAFWALLYQLQIPQSQASRFCLYLDTNQERKNLQEVLEKRKAAIEAQMDEISNSSGNYKELAKTHGELKKIQGAKFLAINRYLDQVEGPITAEKLKEISENYDRQIAAYIQKAPAALRDELKIFSDSQWEAFKAQSDSAARAHYKMKRPISGTEANKLNDLKFKLAEVDQLLSSVPDTKYDHRRLASLLERAAKSADKAELSLLAEIRSVYAQKAPNVPLNRRSKLASEFETSLNKRTKKWEGKLSSRKPKLKWAGAGLLGLGFTAVSMASENSREGVNDAIADSVYTTQLGCADINSNWLEADSSCKGPTEWTEQIGQFVELEPHQILHELKESDRSGKLCRHLLDMHQKHFSSNTEAECKDTGVLVKDHTNRTNYLANWNPSGNLTQVKFNGEYKMYKEYTLGFDAGKISSLGYGRGGSKKVQLPRAALNAEAEHPVTSEVAEHFTRLSPRLMELQGCCMGKISDSRCDIVKRASGSDKSENSSALGTK